MLELSLVKQSSVSKRFLLQEQLVRLELYVGAGADGIIAVTYLYCRFWRWSCRCPGSVGFIVGKIVGGGTGHVSMVGDVCVGVGAVVGVRADVLGTVVGVRADGVGAISWTVGEGVVEIIGVRAVSVITVVGVRANRCWNYGLLRLEKFVSGCCSCRCLNYRCWTSRRCSSCFAWSCGLVSGVRAVVVRSLGLCKRR